MQKSFVFRSTLRFMAMLTGSAIMIGCGSMKTNQPTSTTQTVSISKTTHSVQTENPTLINQTIDENSEELVKVGYSLGYLMGEGNKSTINDLNLDAFDKGFRDSYTNQPAKLTKEHMQKTLKAYLERREAEYAHEMQKIAKDNLEKGQAFLVENGKKENIKTTKSGLQYEVLKTGTGKKPKANDNVKVNYDGKLIDGTVFDSSYQRGEPVVFPLDQVITGWTEGLQLMKEGAKYRFYVPAELAYGEAGIPNIEPNSVLIFEVDLLEVHPKAKKHK